MVCINYGLVSDTVGYSLAAPCGSKDQTVVYPEMDNIHNELVKSADFTVRKVVYSTARYVRIYVLLPIWLLHKVNAARCGW